ncbi:MAG: hypothetical protein ACLFTV_12820, partial [Desulfococcaceae bacterium]
MENVGGANEGRLQPNPLLPKLSGLAEFSVFHEGSGGVEEGDGEAVETGEDAGFQEVVAEEGPAAAGDG